MTPPQSLILNLARVVCLALVLAAPTDGRAQQGAQADGPRRCVGERLMFDGACRGSRFFGRMVPEGETLIDVIGPRQSSADTGVVIVTGFEDHTLSWYAVLPEARIGGGTGTGPLRAELGPAAQGQRAGLGAASAAAAVAGDRIDPAELAARHFLGYRVAQRMTATVGSYNGYKRHYIRVDLERRQSAVVPGFDPMVSETVQHGLNASNDSWSNAQFTTITCYSARYVAEVDPSQTEGCLTGLTIAQSSGGQQSQACRAFEEIVDDLLDLWTDACQGGAALSIVWPATAAGGIAGTALGGAVGGVAGGGSALFASGTSLAACPMAADFVFHHTGQQTGCWNNVAPNPWWYLNQYLQNWQDLLAYIEAVAVAGTCLACQSWETEEVFVFDEASGEGVLEATLLCAFPVLTEGEDSNLDGICEG